MPRVGQWDTPTSTTKYFRIKIMSWGHNAQAFLPMDPFDVTFSGIFTSRYSSGGFDVDLTAQAVLMFENMISDMVVNLLAL